MLSEVLNSAVSNACDPAVTIVCKRYSMCRIAAGIPSVSPSGFPVTGQVPPVRLPAEVPAGFPRSGQLSGRWASYALLLVNLIPTNKWSTHYAAQS